MLGLGIDVVDVARIERLMARRPRFVRRVFSEDEIAYCESAGSPAECFAARWAAREACVKALGGVPGGRWRDIRVVRSGAGPVGIRLEGPARARASEVGVDRVMVSIAHERGTAVACCVALGDRE